MNKQKICIIGDGLTGLITAAILSKQKISIDLYTGSKKKTRIQIIELQLFQKVILSLLKKT